MNDILSMVIDKHSPKVNKNVTEGTAKELLSTIPAFLDSIIRSSIKSLSKGVPLEYIGYRKMTPKEEFELETYSSSNKATYELARSDTYNVVYEFRYMGEIISRPIALPFADHGNLIHISNTLYSIIPVLTDTVISPKRDEVFVRLIKDKLIFRNQSTNFSVYEKLEVGGKVRYEENRKPGLVIYTNIIKTDSLDLKDNIGKPVTPIALYLLGEYGLAGTFKRYFNIGKDDFILINGEPDDNIKSNYTIFGSSKIKPKYSKDGLYKPHDLKFCFKRDIPINQSLENILHGVIYAFDLLPTNAEDLMETLINGTPEDEIFFWRVLLGRLTYKNSYSVDRIIADMTNHFDVLQGYLDTLNKEKLEENGIYVENFFDLLNYILLNYNKWLITSKEYTSSLDNKYIDFLYYLMNDIIIGFNRVILKLNKRASNNRGDQLGFKEVSKLMSIDFKSKRIFNLITKGLSLALQVVDNTLDIKYPRITSILEDQSCGDGVKRAKNSQLPESSKVLRGPDCYFGSLLYISKTKPSPRFKANLYMYYDYKTGRIAIPEHLLAGIQKLDTKLTGKTGNSKIDLLDSNDDDL